MARKKRRGWGVIFLSVLVAVLVLTLVIKYLEEPIIVGPSCDDNPEECILVLPSDVAFWSSEASLASLTPPPTTGDCLHNQTSTATSPIQLVANVTLPICLDSVPGGYGTIDIIWYIDLIWTNESAPRELFQTNLTLLFVNDARQDVVLNESVFTSAPASSPPFAAGAIFTVDMSYDDYEALNLVFVSSTQYPCGGGTGCP